jgi:hypothetical protein
MQQLIIQSSIRTATRSLSCNPPIQTVLAGENPAPATEPNCDKSLLKSQFRKFVHDHVSAPLLCGLSPRSRAVSREQDGQRTLEHSCRITCRGKEISQSGQGLAQARVSGELTGSMNAPDGSRGYEGANQPGVGQDLGKVPGYVRAYHLCRRPDRGEMREGRRRGKP